jgi:hypothetical protein
MNQFSERMSKLSNEDLLRVLEQKTDYQPEAILAAEYELGKRNLSETEIKEIKAEKNTENEINKKVYVKTKDTKNTINNISAEISDTLNPLSRETFRKNLTAVSIIIVIYSAYILINDYDVLKNIGFNGISYLSIEPLTTLTLLLISGIQIWREKKSGWIILTGLLTCYSIVYLLFQIFAIVMWITGVMKPFAHDNDIRFTFKLIGIIAFWLYFNKKEFREFFKINKKTRIITYVTSGIFVAFVIGLITTK